MSDDDNTYFEIDANFACLVIDGKQTAKVNAKAFTDALYGNDIGMLPPAVRWISDSAPWVLLLERPPQYLNLLCAGNREAKLHFPWTLWLMEISTNREVSASVFARPEPLYSFNEGVSHLPLPNINDDGQIKGFTYALQEGAAMGYQLPEAIDAAWIHIGDKIDDEQPVAHSPQGWPQDNYEQLLEHWQDLGPADIAEHPFEPVQDLVVGDLTTRFNEERPDSAFALMKSIIEHIEGSK